MMRTIENLSQKEKEDLLILYAKILANFPGEVQVDPVSGNFPQQLIEGAKYLAPFIYGAE
jgi:hypothetical protein